MDVVSPALLVDLYRTMVRIRAAEDAIVHRYPEQEMRCPVHLCIGQEAVAAGACATLESRDLVFSHHRSHGHYLAKGGDLKTMIAELYGKATGCAGGYGGSMHLIDRAAGFAGAAPIVGGTIPIAAGTALAEQSRGGDRVTMVFLGDGAAETGVFHETLNFAALKALPLVFVCENNLYSVYSAMGVRQPGGRTIADLARGHGMAAAGGDGNDVEAVYGLCRSAVERARNGGGPSFLEFATYRWVEHCGPGFDNHIGYRSEAEFAAWRARCPLGNCERRLLKTAAADAGDMDAIRAEAAEEVAEAFAFAAESPFPNPAGMDAFAAEFGP